MTGLWMRIAGGALIVAGLLAIVLYIQHLHGTVESLTMQRNEARAERDGAIRRERALQKSAQQKIADDSRILAIEKVTTDGLEKIERDIAAGKAVPDNARDLVITCARFVREGNTASPAYRRRCL